MYLDLAESFLYLNIRVLNSDGTNLATGVDLSCTNYLLHSLFDMVEVYMNGKLISSKPFYHYCAYLLNHLSHSETYKKEILKNALYIRDTNADRQSNDNTGYAARKSYLAKSQSVELCGRIMDDVCLQPRWILPLVDFKIKLRRAPVRFTLASAVDTAEYKISIDEAVFYIKNQLVSPKVVELHEKILDKQKALYPLIRNEIKTVSIAKGSKISVTENIFSTVQLPQRIVIRLVETGNYSITYEHATHSIHILKICLQNQLLGNIARTRSTSTTSTCHVLLSRLIISLWNIVP